MVVKPASSVVRALATPDGLFRVRLRQLEIGVEVGIAGDMGVHVDQPGHHRHVAQVNHLVSRLGGNGRGGRDGGDLVAGHHDGLRVEQLAGFYVSKCPARTRVR